jgi:succinate dehydrogenase / fumarate reductase, cytochrome b subunit
MAAKGSAGRPLSPHLQVYRFSLLMALSILHRITGGALYVGTLIVAWWLIALASGPGALALWQTIFLSPLGLLVLFGYTWALFHHMMGGIRHLVWDTGARLDVASAKSTAAMGVAAALVLTILVWVVAFLAR